MKKISSPAIETIPSVAKTKKKIVVLISEGGGGHKMAGEALYEIFSPAYDVEIVSVIRQVIYPLDWFHVLTRGVFTGEDFYNFLLQKGYHKGVHVFATMGNKYMWAGRSKIEKLFTEYLESRTASCDLVISTVPFVNSGIAKSLQKKKVPFLILPTDLDTSTFFAGMRESHFAPEDKIAFALPYNDGDLKKKGLQRVTLPKDKIVITGFPVRGACQKVYTQEQVLLLQLKHGITPGSAVLTLVLGASGNKKIFDYAKELTKLQVSDFSKPIEINVCVGKNRKAFQGLVDYFLQQKATLLAEKEEVSSIKTTEGLVFHIRRFTQELVEIMIGSDLVITKTGSCSVNEAIYLGRKLLLDNTPDSSARYLFWETFNLHFVRKYGLGEVFYDTRELTTYIKMALQESVQHPVSTGAFPLPDFQENIQKVVAQLLG